MSDSTTDHSAGTTTKGAVDFLRFALAQRGDKYVFNSGDPDNPDPTEFDCSGLVRWAAVQCGYPKDWPGIGDWSFSEVMFQICRDAGGELTVEEARQTAGALLFRLPTLSRKGHVAISLGNGSVMHAASPKMGVNVSTAATDYDKGGFLPGMDFPGPISGLPSGRLGEGPVKTGLGLKGATGPVADTPIGKIGQPIEVEQGQIIIDREDGDMLFLARSIENRNLWMRGNGVGATRIRAAALQDVLDLLVDTTTGPIYHNPVVSGNPAITCVEDVPLLTPAQLAAHLGTELAEPPPHPAAAAEPTAVKAP